MMTTKDPKFKAVMTSRKLRFEQGKAHGILTCCIPCSGYHLPTIFCKVVSVERNTSLINDVLPHKSPVPGREDIYCFSLHKYYIEILLHVQPAIKQIISQALITIMVI
jgi:hypothetical protein